MKNNIISRIILKLENDFPKLVRDKIPQLIIKNEGKAAVTLAEKDQDKLLSLAKKKLVEEAMEMYPLTSKKDLITGLADVYEVLRKIRRTSGISSKEVNEYRRHKNKTTGAFRKSIVLISK